MTFATYDNIPQDFETSVLVLWTSTLTQIDIHISGTCYSKTLYIIQTLLLQIDSF